VGGEGTAIAAEWVRSVVIRAKRSRAQGVALLNLYGEIQFCRMVSCSGMLYGVRPDGSLVDVEVVEAEYGDVEG